MPKKAPEGLLYTREFQSRTSATAKPLGPLRAHLSKQRPPENKLYSTEFRERI